MLSKEDLRKRNSWIREMEKGGRKTRLTNSGGNGVILDDIYRWLVDALQNASEQ